MNIFKKFFNSMSNNREIRKWYINKDTTKRYFDEDLQKWVKTSYKEKAKSVLVGTWDGETDILDIMLLKIEHMIVNLKKYGVQADWYIMANDILTDGNDTDKSLVIKKLIKGTLENKEAAKKRGPNYYEESKLNKYSSKEKYWKTRLPIGYLNCAKTEEELESFKKMVENNEVPTRDGVEITNLSDVSESGIIGYYIYHICEHDGFGSQNTYGIEKLINNGSKFVKVESETYFPPYWNMDEIQKYLDSNNIKIDIKKGLINCSDVIYIEPEDYPILSNKVKKHLTGNRQTIKELLALRRKIRKLRDTSDFDDIYHTWVDAPKDKLKEELLKCMAQYRKDRKKMYREIADFMAEKGDTWWD